VVADAEHRESCGELALALLGERGRSLEVREVGRDDRAALAPRARDHRHGGTAVDEGRDGAAREDRLVIRMGVHEQHPFHECTSPDQRPYVPAEPAAMLRGHPAPARGGTWS
jgi:hypothetical protein